MNFVTKMFKGFGLFVLGAVAFWATNKYVLPVYVPKAPATLSTSAPATTVEKVAQKPCANIEGGTSETYFAGSSVAVQHNAVPADQRLAFSNAVMAAAIKDGLINRDDFASQMKVVALAWKIGQKHNVCVKSHDARKNS